MRFNSVSPDQIYTATVNLFRSSLQECSAASEGWLWKSARCEQQMLSRDLTSHGKAKCKRRRGACRICFATLAGSLAQAARKPRVKGFHAESLVRPLLRMARYCNSAMQSAAFLALGHLMSYPAAQQVLCEV